MKQEGILAKCLPGSDIGPALGRASRNPNWRRLLSLQAFVSVSVLARLVEEMAGRMGAQELTQLERVDE